MRGSVDRIERGENLDIVVVISDEGRRYEFRKEHGSFHEGDRVSYDGDRLTIDSDETLGEKHRIARLQDSVLRRRS